MNRLKVFFLAVVLFVAGGVKAQVSFGVKAGLNLSSMTNDEDSKMKVGYTVGPTVEFGFAPNMAIQSGVLLSSKGVKYSGIYIEDIDFDADVTMNANYLQIPIAFAYKFPIAPDTKVYVNAGPYLAFGLFGKTKFKGEIDGESASADIDTFGDDGMGVKRFDFGLTFGLGMEVTKFNFGLNYDLGLTDVVKDSGSKNSNFWISVGYKF
jgi:opacity protein-like surface antigen